MRGDPSWWDLGEGAPWEGATTCAVLLPLMADPGEDYLWRFPRMAREGRARPAAARIFRRRRSDHHPWAWYVAVTWEVACPEPYSPLGLAGGEGPLDAGLGAPGPGHPPQRPCPRPDGGPLRGPAGHNRRDPAGAAAAGEPVLGMRCEGHAWLEALHLLARELAETARAGSLGIRWRGGAPPRFQRLPQLMLVKARLAGVPARWIGQAWEEEGAPPPAGHDKGAGA
ncbi:MAG TPA: hypothetical protein VNL95_06835 [Dehalococcoidia bacterium]|nr:hypothetical protein [Dehalococcoidia bacterium]